MEIRIKERFSPAVLAQARERFDIAENCIHLLDGFESFMYEFEREDGEFILRLAHSLRRTPELIQAEVDWINYLAVGGASVARAIYSHAGRLVEQIEDGQGGYFLATAFVKARGTPPWEYGWNQRLYETYGALLGRMHALSKDYMPGASISTRPQWDDPINLDVMAYLPPTEKLVDKRFQELMDYLRGLPRERESYGLIHQDAHGMNLLVDAQGTITLFDFDDCVYSWFVNDIAIVLFYIAMWKTDQPDFIREFLRAFLTGYSRENHLDPIWLNEIPYFLKLRELDMYAMIYRSFDVENLDDPWCARYMHGRKARLESGTAYIDFDFASLAAYLR
jgi:Ser/Thr protein kinase RdoA (MazF antagonist)